jgi:hypothetical protein
MRPRVLSSLLLLCFPASFPAVRLKDTLVLGSAPAD